MSVDRAVSIAVVGAGPRGVGFLERLAANLPYLAPGARAVVHLIDPHPIGAGRIWRFAQSPLLKLNSMAADVTMFTDVSSTIDGPVAHGPSLIEWVEALRTGEFTIPVDDELLAAEIAGLTPQSFPTRRLQSAYLDWFTRHAIAEFASAGGEIVVHAASATSVEDLADGGQRVVLDTADRVDVDLVLYALGHSGASPEPEHAELVRFARENSLFYLPPAFTADADTSAIPAGERVIVRGLGLAAVDLVVLLTEGRGGRFVPGPDGLDYQASGLEPHLVLGSRRGVPYHSKISSTLRAPRPEQRFFSAAVAQELERTLESLSFRRDVWPLIASEILRGYYFELFTGHPDRVATSWDKFAPFLERYRFDSPRLKAAIAAAVPGRLDRLDLEVLDRPLDGIRCNTLNEVQEVVRSYIRDDLVQRSAPEHSATLGLFTSLLYALFDLGAIIDSPKWTARSRVDELGGGWLNYFSFIASGPPAHRLEELLALSRAGIVTFLGADSQVRAVGDRFEASSASAPGVITARALVDARLPRANLATSDNAALRSLLDSGAGSEEIVSDPDFTGSTGLLRVAAEDSRVIRADGTRHPRRFAIGPFTSAPFVGAFARPRTNAVSFRENDRVARAGLAEVVALSAGRAAVPSVSGAAAIS